MVKHYAGLMYIVGWIVLYCAGRRRCEEAWEVRVRLQEFSEPWAPLVLLREVVAVARPRPPNLCLAPRRQVFSFLSEELLGSWRLASTLSVWELVPLSTLPQYWSILLLRWFPTPSIENYIFWIVGLLLHRLWRKSLADSWLSFKVVFLGLNMFL